MPRPRTGAPIRYTPLNTPGFRGLNKQSEGALLGPEWATRLENTVIDTENRLSTRKGWVDQTTTTAAADRLEQLHEEQATGYLFGSGADNKLYRSTDDADTWTDVTNTATVTDSAGQFHDFNGYVLYVQAGQKPAVYGGTNFTTVADASAPTGGVSLASFGRVWATTSTGKSIRYSGLLDHTDWSSSDTGLIDLTSVWQEDDTITALANFNGSLVVFGKRNIVVFNDGQGSALAIDPLYIYVVDTVSGMGCIARDSVTQIDGDVWFLSQSGLMSFGRLLQQRSNPINNVSQHVQDFMGGYVLAITASDIRAVYSPKDRLYILSLPDGTGGGVAFNFDTRSPMQDGSFRCGGVWNSLVPTAMVRRLDSGDLLLAKYDKTGKVGKYDEYTDDGGSFNFEYESGWTDMGDPNLKLLKRITGILYVGGTITPTFKWAFDFTGAFNTQSVTYGGSGGTAEFGVAEFNEDEYNTGVLTAEKSVAGRKSGEHVKVGMAATINGKFMSIQQIAVYAKQGRLR